MCYNWAVGCLCVFAALPGFCQEKALRGRVVDEAQKPLANVSVRAKHTALETTTDARGVYVLPGEYFAADSCMLVFSYVGKRPEEITVRPGGPAGLPVVVLRDHSLALDEINVSARLNAGSTNSSVVIDRDVIERYPSLSLNDLLNHLPNRPIMAPSVQEMQNVTLRAAFQGSSGNARNPQQLNNAFGVAVIVDDVALSNNATMQGRNPGAGLGIQRANIGVLPGEYGLSGSASTAGGYSGETTFGGIDLRQIPTENIERIEVITGVPSVRYGDLTAGAVIVDRQAGRTPAFLRVQLRNNATSYGFSDGFSMGERWGDVNVNLNYVNSYADNRDKVKQYNRVNGSLIWTNSFGSENRWKHTLSANYGKHIDGVRKDPDDPLSTVVKYDNWNLGLSSRWSFRPSAGFFQRYGLNVSYGIGHQVTYREYHYNIGFVLYTDAVESGLVEGQYDTGQYTAIDHVDGRPVNASVRLEAYAPWHTGRVSHTLNVGATADYSANKGLGRLADPSKPYRALSGNYTDRYYDFGLVVPVWNLGAYAEDRLQATLAGRPLNGALGVRWDMQNGHASFSPRTNLNYQWSEAVNVGLAYGLSFKAPGLAHLYPGPVFNDVTLLNAYNGKAAESLALLYVDRFDPDNGHLRASRSQTFELTVAWQRKGHRFGANLYHRGNRHGITTLTRHEYVSLPVFEATPVPGQRPTVTVVGKREYELSRNVMLNRLVSNDRGVELMYSSPRVAALATSFSASGGLYRTYSFTNTPSYEDGLTPSGTAPTDIVRGMYTPRPFVSYSSHGRVGSATHLPRLKLVVQLTADFRLLNYAATRSWDIRPTAYMTRDLQWHSLQNAGSDHPAYAMLLDVIRTKHRESNAQSNFVSANFHMAVAKELGKRLRLSFNVFNFLDYQPRYYREGMSGVVTPNGKPSFGAEISYKF